MIIKGLNVISDTPLINNNFPTHTPHIDPIASKIGMWLFLFTEILLFGGLFVLFAAYFYAYPEDFHMSGKILSRVLGTTNTVVLITSSLTMALAVGAIQRGQEKPARHFLLITIAFAIVFLIIKYFEWSAKISHGIYPNGAEYLALPKGQMTFFNLYYLMTGLHAVHIIIGGMLITWLYYRVNKYKASEQNALLVENVGLYWHVVDLVWIYLFPLFYLAM